MALTAADTSEASADLALMTGASVLASLTIPGRAEYVSEARSLVGKAIGADNPAADVAILLTSEIVTNAVLHSDSRCPGGTVLVVVSEISAGLRVEVADNGSDLSKPVVRGDIYASDGHGLYLVQTLADQWGHISDETGTTVWFWLSAAAPCRAPQFPAGNGEPPAEGRRPRNAWPNPAGAGGRRPIVSL
jgi:anti-sigma regulatory factor (Ser/Thr protein kinase)